MRGGGASTNRRCHERRLDDLFARCTRSPRALRVRFHAGQALHGYRDAGDDSRYFRGMAPSARAMMRLKFTHAMMTGLSARMSFRRLMSAGS